MGKRSFTCRFSAIALGLLAMAAMISCEDRGTDEASTYAAYVNVANPTFSQLSAAVLIPKCVQCHQEFKSENGLAAAISSGDPDHSALYQMVANGQMPKGGAPLPQSLVKMIRAYILIANQGPVIDLNNVSFGVLNSQIFAPRCLHCHDEFASETGILFDVEPGDSSHSLLYNFVANGKMPKGGRLSRNNIEAIEKWIDGLPARAYPPIAPTYTSLSANLFQRSCVQCHNDGGMADEAFDTWEGVIGYEKEILTKMTDLAKPMPPAHSTLPPSQELIKAYSDWLAAGAPNN